MLSSVRLRTSVRVARAIVSIVYQSINQTWRNSALAGSRVGRRIRGADGKETVILGKADEPGLYEGAEAEAKGLTCCQWCDNHREELTPFKTTGLKSS